MSDQVTPRDQALELSIAKSIAVALFLGFTGYMGWQWFTGHPIHHSGFWVAYAFLTVGVLRMMSTKRLT